MSFENIVLDGFHEKISPVDYENCVPECFHKNVSTCFEGFS